MVNPIKTPQEILFEQAGIPHMAGGGALTAGAKQLFDTAVKRFRAANGRAPNAQEMAQLEQHAQSFAVPTSTGTGLNQARLEQTPAKNLLVNEEGMPYAPLYGKRGTQTTPEQARGYQIDPFGMSMGNVRAREALTVPSQKPFETRDPFLTEAMTGRAPTRTRQKPFTVSLDDLTTQRAAEESAGKFRSATNTEPGGYPAQSTTPSADFFAERSAAIENAKLPTNIRSALREKLGREPSNDEINAFIANLNVAGHNYTGKGAMVFGERPTYGAGRLSREQAEARAKWMQEAIDSGISPSAVSAKPAELEKHYPNLLREMELGPNPKKEGGHITPTQMAHEMLVLGRSPAKFANGRSVVQEDTVYDPMGNVIYSSPLGETVQGKTKTAAKALHNLAAIPATIGPGAISTMAGISQLLGYNEPARVARTITEGVAQRAPIGAKVGEIAGNIVDPATMKLVGLTGGIGKQSLYGAGQGYLMPTDEEDTSFTSPERAINAATTGGFNALLMKLGKYLNK